MKYEPAFDGLRAIAIIFIFLDHAWESTFPGAWAGVDIFFVLSGYLITMILANELSETGQIDDHKKFEAPIEQAGRIRADEAHASAV